MCVYKIPTVTLLTPSIILFDITRHCNWRRGWLKPTCQGCKCLCLPFFLITQSNHALDWANWSAQLNNFFTLTNFTLAAVNQLTDRAKNAYLTTLLGGEGLRILMAHSLAATATTADYNTFPNEVRQVFKHLINPVRAEFEFQSRRQGACKSVRDFFTTLRTLYADCMSISARRPGRCWHSHRGTQQCHAASYWMPQSEHPRKTALRVCCESVSF